MARILKTTFTLVGAVAGAGFVSGRELVSFFGGRAEIHILLLAFLLFFFFFYVLLSAGRKYGSFSSLTARLFGRAAGAVHALFLISSFILTTAMLAGVNALAPIFAPWIALLTAVACFFIVSRGIGGVKMLNAFLTPCIVIYLVVSLAGEGNYAISLCPLHAGMDILFCVLYVCMNAFLSAPVIVDLGAELTASDKGKREAVFSALLPSLVLVGLMFLVLSSVGATEGAAERILPLLAVLQNAQLFPLALFGGIVTSLSSAYYPLHMAASRFKNQTKKNAVRLSLLAAASFCAGWGLGHIVSFVYPALGIFGFLFLTSVVLDRQFFQKHDKEIHHARQKT